LYSPLAFLASAKRSGIIAKIDAWVIKRSISTLQNSPINEIGTFSINLSIQSIVNSSSQDKIITLLENAGASICRRICLELAETAVISNLDETSRFIRKIKKLHVRVAIDNFGGNAPSYKYLKALNIDIIKINGELIKNMLTEPLDASAVRSILDLASVLNVSTVAMHVKDNETLEMIDQLKIDQVQGDLVHVPEPLEDIFFRKRDYVS